MKTVTDSSDDLGIIAMVARQGSEGVSLLVTYLPTPHLRGISTGADGLMSAGVKVGGHAKRAVPARAAEVGGSNPLRSCLAG